VTWPYGVNVLDLEPHGPLPPEIYWRRRGLALGIAVVVIGIVAAIVVAVLGGSAGANTSNTATAKKAAAQAPQNSPAAVAGASPEVKTPVVPPAGQNPDQQVETPTAAVQPPPVLKEGDDCPDSTLAVKGLTNAPQYVIGDQPKFTMVVTNIGLVACKRDVGAAVLAAYVYSLDNKRLWSNLDCAPSNETLVKTFAPGEQVTTAVTWTGMGSAPHCPLPRQPIGPGTYNLVVQLGNLRSATVPFILAPPPPPGAVPPPGAPPPGTPAPPEAGPLPGPPPGPGG
jgi:type II secretory pathway pseudopilin PulG